MKNILLAFFLFGSLSFSHAQQDILGTIMHDGLTRDYRLHLPTNYVEGDELPLVFNLHGYTSQAIEQEFYTSMSTVADNNNFIVCHPNGINNAWVVGFQGESNVDDVGFIDALIDELSSLYSINARKIYSTGMSNGGYMSFKLACELPNRIAAIASVTGSMVPGEQNSCNPGRAIPVMQIHGTADPTVPYAGAVHALATETLVDWWVNNNGCATEPAVTDVPDIDTEDGCTAELYEYTSCNDNTKVEFYKVTGGEHTWPGAGFIIGVTNQDFIASQVIWDFFKQYELPEELISDTQILNDELTLDLSPNPFRDVLNIRSENTGIETVELFNITGQLVWRKEFGNENIVNIPTEDLSNGAYIMKVKVARGLLTKKVIKN